jgi:hypothetical protein
MEIDPGTTFAGSSGRDSVPHQAVTVSQRCKMIDPTVSCDVPASRFAAEASRENPAVAATLKSAANKSQARAGLDPTSGCVFMFRSERKFAAQGRREVLQFSACERCTLLVSEDDHSCSRPPRRVDY